MPNKIPHTPFSMRLSGSAKETELRIRNIFQWKKKRPPIIAFVAAILVVALCGSLVGFRTTAPEEPAQDDPIMETTPSIDAPVQEPPITASDTNNPSVVLTAMASVKAEDFTNPDPNFLGLCVTTEQLAAALNAAVPNQISEEDFFSYGCDSTQIFPHWYIEHAFLEGNPTDFNSKDRHFSIRCGLPENIVEVSLSEDNHRDTAYFEDRALYWLIREKDAFEDRMTSQDPVAYEQFKDLLIDQMERTLARMSDNPGNFTGYQLKRFTIAWTYKDKRDGGQVELYNFSFGLLTDTPETIGWAGGMALDSKLRVVNVGEPKYFAVKYLNEQIVSTAFMASDYELGQTDQDKVHINNALDQASDNPLNQFNFIWDGTPIEFMDLTVLLPDSWNGKVGYERGSPDFIRFYHLESNHYDSYNGTLFYLSWSLGALPLDYPIENGQVLASTQNAAYILSWPTETQCPPETQAEYSTLNLADVQFAPSQELLETSVNRFN